MLQVQDGFTTLKAAADFLGTGAIEINMYESEIMDQVRRTSTPLERFPKVLATGHPHRYFEQTAISTAAFTDPRNIAPSPTSPTRVERPAFIKALVGQSNLSLFDKDVTQQQGKFAEVVAKDINDVISGITYLAAGAVWTGNDTSLSSPTTTQYMGLLSQITLQATIANGASIIDGLKAQVASMVANTTFVVKPTCIFVNPILGDYIDREAKAQRMDVNKDDVSGGTSALWINTQAGKLPIIADPLIPATTDTSYGFSAPAGGYKNYFAVIVTEPEIEMPYIAGDSGTPNPRLFQLGLTGNLSGQYVGIWFNTIIAKGASYNHCVVAVVRP